MGVVGMSMDSSVYLCIFTLSGVAPLHRAAMRGHLKVVNILLEKEADVNARTEHRRATCVLVPAQTRQCFLFPEVLEVVQRPGDKTSPVR